MHRGTVQKGRPRDFDRDVALEKAMETFWLYGYEGTSLSQLTSAMDIRPPSLYAAFGSKEKLFLESVNLYLQRYGAYRETALAHSATAKEGIEVLFERTIQQFFAGRDHKGCFVVLTALSGSQDSSEVQQFLSAERRRTVQLFKARLEQGKVAGDIAAQTDVDALAEYFTALLFGLTIQIRDGLDEASARSLVAVALSVL